MQFKVRGIVVAIGNITTTKKGTAIKQIHLEQDEGKIFYPTALGTKIELLDDIMPGDVVNVDFHISGSKGFYNNVILDNIERI